jgi:hypothetical protein
LNQLKIPYLDKAQVDTSREFLLEKAKREPENGSPHELPAKVVHREIARLEKKMK